MVQSNLRANDSVNEFLDGKHLKRYKKVHPLLSFGLEIQDFQSFLKNDNTMLTDDMIEEVKRLQKCKISFHVIITVYRSNNVSMGSMEELHDFT